VVLDQVLAGARPGTVLRGDDGSGDAADRAAQLGRRAGWSVVLLDTTGALDKAALLDRCQQAFGFPEWFGHNWDALADSLSEVEHPVGTLVLWTGWDGLARADAPAFGTAVEVLTERAASAVARPFAVLLVAPGQQG
jgi:RNAse (barnase) inhibitor barstar